MAGLMEYNYTGDTPSKGIELRNMKQVGPAMKEVHGWRVPNPQLEGPKAAPVAEAASKGLLGRIAAFAGSAPVQGLMMMAHSDPAQSPELMSDEDKGNQMKSLDPEAYQGALDYGKKVGERFAKGAKGKVNGGSGQLLLAPKIKAVEEISKGDPAVEAGRQRIEIGTKVSLDSGAVSLPELAQGVVMADAQKTGQEIAPEQAQKAVAAEVATMQKMSPDNLAKYVSYALIAGGLLASALDKSGESGRMFHDSLNKQLDRNLAAGKMQQAAEQAAVKNALESRKVDVSERDVDSKIDNRTVTAEQGERKLVQGDTALGIQQDRAATARFSAQSQAQLAKAGLGLKEQDLALKQQGLAIRERGMTLKEAAAQSGNKGEKLTTKDATAIVESWAKEGDKKISPAAAANMAQQLRNAAVDPKTKDYTIFDVLDTISEDGQYEVDPNWVPFTSDKIKRKKD